MPKIEITLDARVATLEREIAELKALLKEQASKIQPAGAAVMAAAAAAGASSAVVKSVKAADAPAASPAKEEGISPEIMAVISAAVTHFLGLRARIRQARLVQPMAANPWAQQGRVFIQASHNLSR